MPCCRRRSARVAATRDAARTRRRSPQGAPINQCPPGGAATIEALARLLQRAALPLDPANGAEAPPRVALIDETALHRLRQVPAALSGGCHHRRAASTCIPWLLELCTGCELCIAPCPVDCITHGAALLASAVPAHAIAARRIASDSHAPCGARLRVWPPSVPRCCAARKRGAQSGPGQP